MATRDIIVIGSSAGGVDALTRLCADFPPDLPAAVFVAQHLSPSSRSLLPHLLDRAGPLPALSPIDGQVIEPGHIYVAPPDHHLLVREGRMLVRRGPHENRTRPAANALFRSAALAYGARVIGVVLTGLLDDGSDGLVAIKRAGGVSVVQDPADAEWPSMPSNAVRGDHVDHIAPLADIAKLLTALVGEEAGTTVELPHNYREEDRIAAEEFAVVDDKNETPGNASRFSCPDCGGVLNEIANGTALRFRCQVGHAFTPLGLARAQNDGLERALSVAVRTHQDRIRLFTRLAEEARTNDLPHARARWEEACVEAELMISVIEKATAILWKPAVNGDM